MAPLSIDSSMRTTHQSSKPWCGSFSATNGRQSTLRSRSRIGRTRIDRPVRGQPNAQGGGCWRGEERVGFGRGDDSCPRHEGTACADDCRGALRLATEHGRSRPDLSRGLHRSENRYNSMKPRSASPYPHGTVRSGVGFGSQMDLFAVSGSCQMLRNRSRVSLNRARQREVASTPDQMLKESII